MFGALVKCILKQVCQKTSIEIHLVFDKTIHSLKIVRNDNRHVACQITGADQKRSSNWLQSLGVDKFKEALVEFVITF